jgi:23S rRNA (adenine2030-N6)-methyltransferase
MNYRHIYHAGNFADIFKHLILTMVVGYLQQKDKGLFILDAFAGIGLYDLNSVPAQKTQEYADGVSRFLQEDSINPDLQFLQRILSPYWQKKLYMGSPLLLAQSLRPQDRLVANELHPEDYKSLKINMASFERVLITQKDAYEVIRSFVPPPEKRGLVLVDPPFEIKNEFSILAEQIFEWHKRWATGVYIIWYPIKADFDIEQMTMAARDAGFAHDKIKKFEILINPREKPDSLNGCGVLILNPPYQLEGRYDALKTELEKMLIP